MNKHNTDELYKKFPHLYRERTAPLESSKMAWGFQCEDGWYKIIYEMSRKIQKLSGEGDFAPAITEVTKNTDGTLHVEARNLMPAVATVITAAQEQSKLTCELCSYSPAFLRGAGVVQEGHIACGRCVGKGRAQIKSKPSSRKKKPLRAPEPVVVKR